MPDAAGITIEQIGAAMAAAGAASSAIGAFMWRLLRPKVDDIVKYAIQSQKKAMKEANDKQDKDLADLEKEFKEKVNSLDRDIKAVTDDLKDYKREIQMMMRDAKDEAKDKATAVGNELHNRVNKLEKSVGYLKGKVGVHLSNGTETIG